jgi:hypothetical protein
MDRILSQKESARKLASGLFRLASVSLFYTYLGPDWVSKVQKDIVSWLSTDPDSAGADLIAKLFGAVIGLWLLYWFVTGIYRIYTFNMYMDAYETRLTPFQKRHMCDTDPDTSNINAALRYRDAKMRTMTPEQAADYYLVSSRIIGGTDNKKVIGYINSRMTLMTPEQRVDYLSGKKRK